jgi:hypothetical protein
MAADVPTSLLKVTMIGVRVTFDLQTGQTKQKTRSFELRWPNSCNLKEDDYGIFIRHMLADHGIEPSRPADDGTDGGQGH